MNHTTSIGLDVHARSIAAAALDPLTGEVVTKTFAYSPGEVASWALGFDSSKAVYESGVTGFHLCRELNALGLECAVGASSKMQRPPADVKRKNDLSDAQFLARLLATHNVTEVFVPDAETEAARDLVRAHADARADLTRARQRLNLFLMRHGHVFCEKGPTGAPVGSWTKAHWAWIRQISFPDEADEEALAFYIAQVRHMEGQKRELEKFIRAHAREPRWRGRVDALRCLKGIEEITAFALVAEAGVFSRFDSARAFSTWGRARALRALQRPATTHRRHNQDGQLQRPQAAGGGVVALRQGDRRAQARPEPRRAPAYREPCRQGREEARGQAAGDVRARQAALGRQLRHGARACVLVLGDRPHGRGGRRVAGALPTHSHPSLRALRIRLAVEGDS